MTKPPPDFTSWEECRDFHSLEALFLGQLHDRRPGPRNKRAYQGAARKAVAANEQCAEPIREDPSDG